MKIAKIGDFGMAYHLEEDEYYFELPGPEKLPVRWLSPEASRNWKFSHASDVWAFGVTLWEICTLGRAFWKFFSSKILIYFVYSFFQRRLGERPYKDLHNREIQRSVKDGRRLEKSTFSCKYMNKSAKQFYSRIYDLMTQMWAIKPISRPSPAQVLSKIDKLFHAFL